MIFNSSTYQEDIFILARHTRIYDQLIDTLNTIIPDLGFRKEIVAEYNIGLQSAPSLLSGLVQIGTDGLFRDLALDVTIQSPVPASLYVFDHKGTFPDSPLKGYARHAFDNCFFARYPSVVGTNATRELLATSNFTTSWISTFVYGEQPWKVWDMSASMGMAIGESRGSSTGLERVDGSDGVDGLERIDGLGGVNSMVRKFKELERIGRLTSTAERKKVFEAAEHKLLSF